MSSEKNIQIDGIPVRITKKKMKNMYIRVDSATGLVKVSVPAKTTYDTAINFVRKNMDWVVKTRDKYLSDGLGGEPEYVTGEKIRLWGREYTLEFIPSYMDKEVCVADDSVCIYAPKDSDADDRKAMIDKWYRQELSRAINGLKDECESITGKSPKEWRIKAMKTKWGTCNYVEGRIWISLQIAERPKECLKYVMLHELTHLYVPNHGPEFKAYMDRFCPDWRQLRKLLNSKSQEI